MFYPKDFKEKVLQKFNNDSTMQNSLELGTTSIGPVLKSHASKRFTADEILFAARSHDFDSLIYRAKKQQEYQALYEEWKSLYEQWNKYCATYNLSLEEL